MATPYNLTNLLEDFIVIIGNHTIFNFEIYDTDGSPVNLTGKTCRLRFSPMGYTSLILANLLGTISGPSFNVITFILPSATTNNTSWSGKVEFQLEIQYTGSIIYYPASGIVTFKEKI
jgi:hypothetical protein